MRELPERNWEIASNLERKLSESTATTEDLRTAIELIRVDTVEEMYGVDFDVRGDMRLGTLLSKEDTNSLSKLLENTLPKSK